jgi:glycosyltransferase involved in cell wall biosynthesis
METVSILVPVFNKSKFIHDTLYSIDRQITPDQLLIEVLIVDDASTDDSIEQIHNYQWENKQITVKVFQNEVNRGPAFSFNIALANATGNYIIPFDADDLLTRLGVLSRYLAIANSDLDWVSGNELIVDFGGGIKPGRELSKVPSELTNSELITAILRGDLIIPAQSLIIRAQTMKQLRWIEEMRSSQDVGLNLTLLANNCKGKFIYDYVAIYRSHKDNQQDSLYHTSIMSGQKARDFATLRDKLADKLDANQKQLITEIITRLENHPLRQQDAK